MVEEMNMYFNPQQSAYPIYNYNQQASKTPIQQPVQQANNKTTRIKNLYINDVHSHADGFSKIETEVSKFRNENAKRGEDSFVFVGGDSYVGGNDKKNHFIIKLLNIIKPDANVSGNHEFDWKGSLGLSQRMDHQKFPTLGLNIKLKPNSALDDDVKAGRLAKSIVVEKNGEKFGVIGLSPTDLFMRVSQQTKDYCKDFDIMKTPETHKAVQEEINRLEKAGINKIVVVSHMGYDADVAMAKAVNGIDVIHGAHSHHLLPNLVPGVNYFTSQRGEPVIITQAGKNGHDIGILDVVYDAQGKIIQAKNEIKSLKETAPSLIADTAEKMFMGTPQVVGSFANDSKLLPEYALEENPISSFLCDSYKKYTGADIVLNNAGTLRASLKQGPITDSQLSDILPYYNEVSVYKFSEKEIVDTLNNAIEATRKYNRTGAVQVSGLQYTIGKDDKIKDIYLVKDDGTKEAIDSKNPKADKFYTVAYNSFLGGGTEGLMNLNAPEKRISVAEKTETAMLIDYIKSFNGEPIKVEKTGRIIHEE